MGEELGSEQCEGHNAQNEMVLPSLSGVGPTLTGVEAPSGMPGRRGLDATLDRAGALG